MKVFRQSLHLFLILVLAVQMISLPAMHRISTCGSSSEMSCVAADNSDEGCCCSTVKAEQENQGCCSTQSNTEDSCCKGTQKDSDQKTDNCCSKCTCIGISSVAAVLIDFSQSHFIQSDDVSSIYSVKYPLGFSQDQIIPPIAFC